MPGTPLKSGVQCTKGTAKSWITLGIIPVVHWTEYRLRLCLGMLTEFVSRHIKADELNNIKGIVMNDVKITDGAAVTLEDIVLKGTATAKEVKITQEGVEGSESAPLKADA